METYLILHDNTTNSMETQPIFHEQVCFYALLLSMFPCTTTCRYVSMETYLICRTYLIVHGNSRWVVTINDVNYQQKYVQNIIVAVQIGSALIIIIGHVNVIVPIILHGNIPNIVWKHTQYCIETYLVLHGNIHNIALNHT